ncbi:Alpha-1A adrenergic receptor [Ooceraea biroi]|uniref:Alpha-1A adrenergic receptor n=2 Tax=Ooceraea biroi TaxID=2015173 RepID=A0A026X2D4_OOCBI|nr:Alpha-1A adrenergic receptor [Ooceraea biroi]
MYLAQDNITETNVNVSVNVSDESSLSEANLKGNNNVGSWIVEGFIFIAIVLGNALTIMAIVWSRRLRSVMSNYFILSLAASDLLVGLTLPYHLAFYMTDTLHHKKFFCILRFVVVNLGCTGSVYSLIAIAIDRYIAIVYPLSYNVYATHRYVLLTIVITWICTLSTSLIPIYWNNFESSRRCIIDEVLPRYYILAIELPSFILCCTAMVLLYWKIWKEARMHRRRMTRNVVSSIAQTNTKTDRKSNQVVILILGCFSISWLPFCVIAITRIFFVKTPLMNTFYRFAHVLALANSGMNPIIYAWKNANFRRAFQKILHFKSPNSDLNSSFRTYLEKQHELKRQQTNVRKDSHMNESTTSHSFDQQSNQAEENKTENTAL